MSEEAATMLIPKKLPKYIPPFYRYMEELTGKSYKTPISDFQRNWENFAALGKERAPRKRKEATPAPTPTPASASASNKQQKAAGIAADQEDDEVMEDRSSRNGGGGSRQKLQDGDMRSHKKGSGHESRHKRTRFQDDEDDRRHVLEASNLVQSSRVDVSQKVMSMRRMIASGKKHGSNPADWENMEIIVDELEAHLRESLTSALELLQHTSVLSGATDQQGHQSNIANDSLPTSPMPTNMSGSEGESDVE